MRPVLVIELPQPGVGRVPALADCRCCDLDRVPVLRRKHVVAGRSGHDLENLAQAVKLELAADPVPGHGSPSRVSAQLQLAFGRHRLPGNGVGGCQLGTGFEHPLGKAAPRRGPRRMAWAVGYPRDRRSPDNPSPTGRGARKADRRLP